MSKSFIDTLKTIRRTWGMNPRTRVQENEKKNKKKAREAGKKESKNSEDRT